MMRNFSHDNYSIGYEEKNKTVNDILNQEENIHNLENLENL
jgi:hypothetical protein